jgi:hypothetical protein
VVPVVSRVTTTTFVSLRTIFQVARSDSSHLCNMLFHLFIFLCGLFPPPAVAQYQFYNLTTAGTDLSSTCVSVLNQAVSCDTAVSWAGKGRYEDDATLATLCTTTCTNALSTWLRRVAGACTVRYNNGKGNAVLPAYWVESIVENYNIVCQKNGYVSFENPNRQRKYSLFNSDKFCNAVVRDGFGVDPGNQSKTKTTSKKRITHNRRRVLTLCTRRSHHNVR